MKPRVLGLLLFLGAVAACGGTSQSATSHAMVATLLGTPDVTISGEALAPGSGVSPDAGYTVPGEARAFVFLGERDRETLDTPPQGVPAAAVTLRPQSFAESTLQDRGDGTYTLTTAQDATLQYRSGVTYEFRAALPTETFTAKVEQVPPMESINALHPVAKYVLQDAGQPLTLTRPPPPSGIERPLGFVTVVPVTPAGQGQPTWTNVPSAPLDFLRLFALPGDWKATDIVIPGSAFPAPAANYLVIFQAAKLGRATSQNLFQGSTILAGTADTGVVRTR